MKNYVHGGCNNVGNMHVACIKITHKACIMLALNLFNCYMQRKLILSAELEVLSVFSLCLWWPDMSSKFDDDRLV